MLSPPCWQAFLVLWFAGTDCWSQEFCSDGTLLHEDVCLPRSYSRINLPTYNLLEISADFGVRAIREVSTNAFKTRASVQSGALKQVNDFEMTVTLDMEMSFEWQEPRLQVDPEGAGSLAEGMESLDFEMSFPLLWKPGTLVTRVAKAYLLKWPILHFVHCPCTVTNVALVDIQSLSRIMSLRANMLHILQWSVLNSAMTWIIQPLRYNFQYRSSHFGVLIVIELFRCAEVEGAVLVPVAFSCFSLLFLGMNRWNFLGVSPPTL